MNDWINWKPLEDDDKNLSSKYIFSKKFKILVFLFSILCILLINLKLIEVLSLADGQVIPQGRIKYVQHLEGGIVDQILVKEGELVQINQPLVVLSKEKASSDFEEIDTRLKSIDLAIYRVQSEKNSLKKLLFLKKNLTFLTKI